MQNRSTPSFNSSQNTLARDLIAVCYLSNYFPTFEYYKQTRSDSRGYIASKNTLTARTAKHTASLLQLLIGFQPMITHQPQQGDSYHLKIFLDGITDKDIKKMAAHKTKRLNQLANFLNQLNYPGTWNGIWSCIDNALFFTCTENNFRGAPATYAEFEERIKKALIDYCQLPCYAIELNTILRQRERNILKKPAMLYLDYHHTNEYELPITPFCLVLIKSMKKLLPKTLQIPANQIELLKKIDSGSFGTVYKGLHKNNIVAIKVTNPCKEDTTRGIINEQRILRMLTTAQTKLPLHAGRYNIIQFNGYTMNARGNTLRLVMEYLDVGSLETFIKNNPTLCTNPNNKYIFADIAHGLGYLHHYEIIHCDLKPGNVLLTQDAHNQSILHAKLIDFGLSKHKKDNITDARGTVLYFAPETLDQFLQNEKSDIFSMSNTFWEMTTGETIYNRNPTIKIENELYTHVVTKQQRAIIPTTCPKKISFWIEKGWHPEPEQRPTADECATALDALTDQDMTDTIGTCTVKA